MVISLPFLVRVLPLLLPLWTAQVAAVCYLRNGTDINESWGNSDRYASCNPEGSGASMCCSINGGGDTCAPIYANNPSLALCNNQDGNLLWRESCTDEPWLSVNCVKLFMNVTDQDVTVTNCSAYNLGEGFCYGTGNTGCCRNGEAVFIDPVSGEQVATNPALSTSSSTSTTPTSSPASTPTSSQTASASSGLSTGAKAGIGVGVSLGVVALLLIAGIVVFRKRRNSKSLPTTTQPAPYQPYPSAKAEKAELSNKPKYLAVSELGSDGQAQGRNFGTRSDGTHAAELAG